MKKVLLLIMTLIVLVSCGKQQETNILTDEELQEIGNRLTFFTMKKDVTDDVASIKHYCTEQALNELSLIRESFTKQREFYRGDLEEQIKIHKIHSEKTETGYVIYSGYIEESLFDIKYTTIIKLDMTEGLINEIQIWDLLDNPPSSDWMWAEG